MDKVIKCAACGYEYDQGKPSWEQEGEFQVYECEAHLVGFGHDEEISLYILACPKCKTLRLER